MQYRNIYLTESRLRDILKSLGITTVYDTTEDIMCYCPFHYNMDSPAFGISKNSPYLWRCFNGSCGRRGNIFSLLTQKGYTQGEAEKRLQSGIMEPDDFLETVKQLMNVAQEEENQWLDVDWNKFVLGDMENDYPAKTYVLDRGISLEAYEYFRLGYSSSKHRVVIPVNDEHGTLVGLIGRAIDNKSYLYSKSLKRHATVWNLDEAKHMDIGAIILCEGAFDAISVWDAGHKSVGAIFGSSISPAQCNLIRKYFYEVICFFDNDQAGYGATDQVIQSFPDLQVSYVEYPTRLIQLEDGTERPVKDPGELTKEEIAQMLLNRKTKFTRMWGNE